MKKIMMIAGEPSGDLHGSLLAIELKKVSPEIQLFGIGGEKMKAAGVNILFDIKDLAIIGLFDVIKNIFRLKRIQNILLDKVKQEKPDLIILIDYPDFNLRFAQKINNSTPVIYYISPQIWAWRKGRIKLIKKYVKKIYVIFKFEEELYRKEGVPVEFIGHPLLDIVKSNLTKEDFLKQLRLKTTDKIIALLPGSRVRLVKTLLPIMLAASRLIYKKFSQVQFLISKSPSINIKIYEKILNKFDLPVSLVEHKTYEIINSSDVILAVSGTSTLETAILGKPMLIIYKLPFLEYILARPLLKLKNIGLVNIVAGEEIVPEFIQFKARPKTIAETAIDMLTNKTRYEFIKTKLSLVKNSLSPDAASKRAAASILNMDFRN